MISMAQGRRAALGASTGVAVRRAGGAGGGAAAPPPVAVRRCRLVQPTRKLTTAAFAGVDPATYYAGVDLFGPYVTMERVAILACAGIATQLFLEKNKVSNDTQEEGKLKAENEALRTRVDDAEAAVSSLLARVDGLEAEHAALRSLPSPEA